MDNENVDKELAKIEGRNYTNNLVTGSAELKRLSAEIRTIVAMLQQALKGFAGEGWTIPFRQEPHGAVYYVWYVINWVDGFTFECIYCAGPKTTVYKAEADKGVKIEPPAKHVAAVRASVDRLVNQMKTDFPGLEVYLQPYIDAAMAAAE